MRVGIKMMATIPRGQQMSTNAIKCRRYRARKEGKEMDVEYTTDMKKIEDVLRM
jgi:hypothetical protein